MVNGCWHMVLIGTCTHEKGPTARRCVLGSKRTKRALNRHFALVTRQINWLFQQGLGWHIGKQRINVGNPNFGEHGRTVIGGKW